LDLAQQETAGGNGEDVYIRMGGGGGGKDFFFFAKEIRGGFSPFCGFS